MPPDVHIASLGRSWPTPTLLLLLLPYLHPLLFSPCFLLTLFIIRLIDMSLNCVGHGKFIADSKLSAEFWPPISSLQSHCSLYSSLLACVDRYIAGSKLAAVSDHWYKTAIMTALLSDRKDLKKQTKEKTLQHVIDYSQVT